MRLLALTTLSCAACTTLMFGSPPALTPTPPVDYPVAAPADQVWARLTEAYTDRNIPIANMDRASWFLRSGEMTLSGRMGTENATKYFDCGTSAGPGTERATENRLAVSITTLLKPAGDTTMVRTTATATAHAAGYGSINAQQYPCVSTGALERELVESLRDH